MTTPVNIDLVLASSSRYRRELLARVIPRFRTCAPAIKETPRPGETAMVLAERLAFEKALAVARQCSGALVIGSDQVAECEGSVLGKPGGRAQALAQLASCSGRVVTFRTAVCVVDARSGRLENHSAMDVTRAAFRTLQADEITRYVEREPAFDCAAGFRVEGLGITLFERIESGDPTALVGLPLIALCRLLRAADYPLP
ncbi:MAG: Maf family nucleotide pyrophosphatase [Rhodanobacteraceae bacterium]